MASVPIYEQEVHGLKRVCEYLSQNLVLLRRKQGLTQGEVAKLASVPRSTIAHMESGSGNPTLTNLSAVAGALRVSLEELLSPPRPVCKLVKSRELERLSRGQGTGTLIRLLPDPVPGLLMDRMEIEVAGRIGGVPHLSGTKEYFTCISGEVTVYVAGTAYRVQEGDVLAFPGDQAHSYNNTGNRKAVCLSVVALASAG